MNAKEFLKPNLSKILIFLSISIFYLYFASESVCGAGFFFAFCYKAYGFPSAYLISGDISSSMEYIETLPLAQFFYNTGKLLFNPAVLLADALLIYLLACFCSVMLKTEKST